MEERRRAELLVIRLRWAVLIVGAFMIDESALKLASLVVMGGVFLYNVVASQIASDKDAYLRYGSVMTPVTRVLDAAVITLASCTYSSTSGDLCLLYSFVIVSTAYSYNRFTATLVAFVGTLILDVGSIFYRLSATRTMGNFSGEVTQDVMALLAATLVATYIIALRKQDENMRMKERKLSALFECGTRFTSASDLDQLLNHILETAISETGASGGRVVLVDPVTAELQEAAVRHSHTLTSVADQERDYAVERCVVSTGQALLLQSGSTNEASKTANSPERPTVCVPLVERTSQAAGSHKPGDVKIVGTLSVYSDLPNATFGHEDLDLLRTLAIHASMGIVNANLYRELKETFLKVLQSLARSLEARDPYTQGHSYRVSEISRIVAEHLALPDHVVEIIRNAALLHDIGKIGVPDAVLQKPSKLTPEERLIIQTHPTTGENICRPLNLGEEVLFLIRHHQERLNGTGYPDQLRADQQPLPLRIICAVDSLDAMSSDRPYRKALSAAQRVEQLNRGAGSEFDPVVVEVLKSLLSSGVLDRFYTSTNVDDEELPMAA